MSLDAALELDLNSDLSEPDEDVEMTNELVSRHELLNPVVEELKREHSEEYNGLMNSESVTSLRLLSEVTQFSATEELDDGGFTDIEGPRFSPVNPFHTSEDSKPKPKNWNFHKSHISEPAGLSLAQQSRFVQYIDNRLLQIQRNFIKYLSSENKSQSGSPFTLTTLLKELSSVLNFIWYSIFETKTIPVVTNKFENEFELPLVHPTRLFGQTDYLIKIMGDLTDYIQKYDFEEWHELTDLLQLLKKIDSFVSILIDQTESNDTPLINNTERVRMDSIITRTKLTTIQKFEHMKFKIHQDQLSSALGAKRKHDHTSTEEADPVEGILHKYEEKIGEIYEGIIDRTSI